MVALALLGSYLPTALAHRAGTDGGTAERGCKPVRGGSLSVGATDVSCSTARKVASRAAGGDRPGGWRCTGVGKSFGHCHRGGSIAHWAVND